MTKDKILRGRVYSKPMCLGEILGMCGAIAQVPSLAENKSQSRLIIKYMGKLCLSERLWEIYDYEMKLNKNAEKIIWVAVTVLFVYQEYSIQSSFYHIITSITIRSPAYHRIFILIPKAFQLHEFSPSYVSMRK